MTLFEKSTSMQIIPFPAHYQLGYHNFDFSSFSRISCRQNQTLSPYEKVFILLIILTAIAVPESFAQETTSTTTTDLPLARLHITGSKNRPRTVVPLWIDCYYDSGIMYFDSSEGNCNVEVIVTDLNSGISRIFYLSNNDSPLLINLESGTYSILYVADENEYEGILNLY